MTATATPDYINVANAPYNAPNDGTSDAGPAINQAIAAIGNPTNHPNGGIIYIPTGPYLISTPVGNLKTTGSITIHTTSLTMADVTNLAAGHVLAVEGAGPTSTGGVLIATVTQVNGNTVMLNTQAAATVSGAQVTVLTNSLTLLGDGLATTQLITNGPTDILRVSGPLSRFAIRNLFLGAVGNVTDTDGTGIAVIGMSGLHSNQVSVEDVEMRSVYTGLYVQYSDDGAFRRVRILRQDTGGHVNGGYPCMVRQSLTHVLEDVEVTAPGTGVNGYNEPGIVIEGDTDTIVLLRCLVANTQLDVPGFDIRNTIGASSGSRLLRLIACYSELAGNGSNTSDGVNRGWGGDGFRVSDGRDVRLIGCHAANNSAHGYNLAGGTSVNVTDSLALENQRHGILVNPSGSSATASVKVEGCTASDNGQYTVLGTTTKNSASVAVASSQNFAAGDTVKVVGAGVSGADLTTTVQSVAAGTITLTVAASTAVQFTPVIGMTPAYDGIAVAASATNVRVACCRSGNFVFGSGMQRYGLSIDNTGTDYVSVVGCDLTDNATASLDNSSPGTHNQLGLNLV